MKLIKIGIANPDPTVGAFNSNTALLIEFAQGMTVPCVGAPTAERKLL